MILRKLQDQLAKRGHHSSQKTGISLTSANFRIPLLRSLFASSKIHNKMLKDEFKTPRQLALPKPSEATSKKEAHHAPENKEALGKSQFEVRPKIARELEEIMPGSAWVRWMRVYLLISKYYNSFGKALILILLLSGSLASYAVYYLIRNPSRLDFRAVFQEEVENAALESTLEELATKLRQDWLRWQHQSQLYRGTAKEMRSEMGLERVSPQDYLTAKELALGLEGRTQDCLGDVFLSGFFEWPGFEQALEEGQLVYLRLKHPTTLVRSSQDPLRQMRIVVKGVQGRLGEVALRRLRRKGKYRVLLVIDQLQELGVYLEDPERKKQLLNIYHQLAELSQSGMVNLVVISYDSVFLPQLLQEVKQQERPLLKVQQKTVLTPRFKALMETHLSQYSELSLQTSKKISSLLVLSQWLAHHNEVVQKTNNQNAQKVNKTADKAAKTSEHSQEDLAYTQAFFQERTVEVRDYLKRTVFKGEPEECKSRIQLLIRVLLHFSDRRVWADEDLAIQNLNQQERKAYRHLCRHQILFYLRFYRYEYRLAFFDIIRDNQHYHPLFMEEYGRLKTRTYEAYRYMRQLHQSQEELQQGSWIAPESLEAVRPFSEAKP